MNKENKKGQSNERAFQCKWDVEDECYIHKFVDFSIKYGVGYSLTNGCLGIAFNDNSYLVLRPDKIQFSYFEKHNPHEKHSYTVHEFPDNLKKKVTLLKHFKQALETKISHEESSLSKSQRVKELVYVKKWLKTKHALVLKLSNKVMQVNFEDGTELIMSSKTKKVSLLDKKGQRVTYPVSHALKTDNKELIKRLNYAR